jgi:hypothetical protein
MTNIFISINFLLSKSTVDKDYFTKSFNFGFCCSLIILIRYSPIIPKANKFNPPKKLIRETVEA